MALFPRLISLVEARVERTGRHIGMRAALWGCLAVAGITCFVFLLVLATTALSVHYGTMQALGIMAAASFLVAMLILLALQIEGRRYRRLAARSRPLDAQLMQAAAFSAAASVPRKMPSRTAVGLGMVALGAFLVMRRRG